jgi:hypothetical protein
MTTKQVEGRFSVIEARVARMASDRFAAETGFLVLDQSARIVYRMKRKSDAVTACNRLNIADAA